MASLIRIQINTFYNGSEQLPRMPSTLNQDAGDLQQQESEEYVADPDSPKLDSYGLEKY